MTLEEACNAICENINRNLGIDIGNGDVQDIFSDIWETLVSDFREGSPEFKAARKIEEVAGI